MKRTLAILTAAFMASATFPALAGGNMEGSGAAQLKTNSGQVNSSGNAQLGSDTNMDDGAELDADMGIDTQTTAATEPNFGSVISAIRADKVSPAEIESMDVSSVNIVRVDTLTGADPQALENALEEKQAEISELRSAIQANTALSAQLEGQDLDADDVVATEIGAGGELTVYVHEDSAATDMDG
jgi:hypothetical protein